jgi:hypothetical protein
MVRSVDRSRLGCTARCPSAGCSAYAVIVVSTSSASVMLDRWIV